ncbi:MAG: ABC transporter permease [Thiomicrospira sp.]|jgi:lipopolysaccharide transport system permease protein
MKLGLILHFAKQDLIDKYRNSLLGMVWNLIMPLVMISIFIFVFSTIMGARLSDFEGQPYAYSIYLIAGILYWNLFASVTQRIAGVYDEKRDLIKKNKINLRLLPLYVILTETFIFLITLMLFSLFVFAIGHGFSLAWAWLILPYLAVILMAYCIGLFFATFSIFIRDLKNLLGVFLQLWFWITPIVYVINILPQSVMPIMYLNPMYWITDLTHNIILYKTQEGLLAVGLLMLLFVPILFALLKLSAILEKDVRDFL